MTIDLEKMHQILQSFKTENGLQRLTTLNGAFNNLKSEINSDNEINDAEFLYILETLVKQKRVEDNSETIVDEMGTILPGGFVLSDKI